MEMSAVWKTLLWALAVSLMLASVILFVLFRYVMPSDAVQRPSRYTIGAWEGQVAVFEGDSPYPRQVFDVYVDTLPPQQRQEVLEGVPAEDDSSLSILLEDYTG